MSSTEMSLLRTSLAAESAAGFSLMPTWPGIRQKQPPSHFPMINSKCSSLIFARKGRSQLTLLGGNQRELDMREDFFWEWETCPRARRIAERSPVRIYRSVIRKTSSVGFTKCRVYDQSVTGWDSRHSNSFICLWRSCGRNHFWRRIVRNKPQAKMFVGFRIRGVFFFKKFSDIKEVRESKECCLKKGSVISQMKDNFGFLRIHTPRIYPHVRWKLP